MNKAGVWVGIVILVFAGAFLAKSLTYNYYGKFGPGPGLLPVWVFGTLVLFSLAFIFDSMKSQGLHIRDILPTGQGLKKVLSIFVSLILFIIAAPYTGYCIASVLMLLILFAPSYQWYSNLLISVAVTAVIFYVFNSLLSVPLPINSYGF